MTLHNERMPRVTWQFVSLRQENSTKNCKVQTSPFSRCLLATWSALSVCSLIGCENFLQKKNAQKNLHGGPAGLLVSSTTVDTL